MKNTTANRTPLIILLAGLLAIVGLVAVLIGTSPGPVIAKEAAPVTVEEPVYMEGVYAAFAEPGEISVDPYCEDGGTGLWLLSESGFIWGTKVICDEPTPEDCQPTTPIRLVAARDDLTTMGLISDCKA